MTIEPVGRLHRSRSEGSALIILAVAIVMLAGLGIALSMTSWSASKESDVASDEMRALYAAEAAVREASAVLEAGGRVRLDAMSYPLALRGTPYSVHVTYGDEDAGMGDDLVRLVGTATQGDEEAAVELMLRLDSSGGVPAGAFGDSRCVVDDDSFVDSYDSSAGSYASQATNTWNGMSYANSNAVVNSNTDIDVTDVSSVFGDAHPGPSSLVNIGASSQVTGSTAPSASSESYPAVVVPTITSTGDYDLDSSATLSAGNYSYGTFELHGNATLTIEGPARLVLGTATIRESSKLIADTTNGPVEIWVTGTFDLKQSSQMYPQDSNPAGLVLQLSSTANGKLRESAPTFTGIFYGPDAPLDMDQYSEIFGSVVANDLEVDNWSKVHIDESLLSGGPMGSESYVQVSWRPLSPIQVESITGP